MEFVLVYTRYLIVARRASAFRPSASREQRYLAYKICSYLIPSSRASIGILHTILFGDRILYTRYLIVALGLPAAECVARAKVSCIQALQANEILKVVKLR